MGGDIFKISAWKYDNTYNYAGITNSSVEIAPTESNYQQIKSEIVSNAMTNSSVEDENTTEEEERSQNITCHIVALADLVMSEKPTWTPYNKPMDEASCGMV